MNPFITRRNLLRWGAGLTSLLFTSKQGYAMNDRREKGWYMPDESARHKKTWMAFIADPLIWGKKRAPFVEKDLIHIATTIAKYEPVSLLARKQDKSRAKQLLAQVGGTSFPVDIVISNMNDLWLRDTGPTFVINSLGEKAAINFNFNGWGEKQEYDLDAEVASFITQRSGVSSIISKLILEGGCFEVDGEGTAIMTESCILNNNRNPGVSKAQAEDELMELLGLDKIIWLEGIKGMDITDGHTDFYARFAHPGVVIASLESDSDSFDYEVTREHLRVLQSQTDSTGRALEVITLESPWKFSSRFGMSDFAAGYVGYYVCNGAVIMQKFADRRRDQQARDKLKKAFPEHQIEQISIDAIASGGGSIHCATQQEPYGLS